MNDWTRRFHRWLVATGKWNDYMRYKDNAHYAAEHDYKTVGKWARRALAIECEFRLTEPE